MPRLSHTSDQAAQIFLALLQQPDRWWHGYALMKETELKSGSLYPLLIRLSDEGLLEARWQTPDDRGRPRREFRLTKAGETLASERIARFHARQAKQRGGAAIT